MMKWLSILFLFPSLACAECVSVDLKSLDYETALGTTKGSVSKVSLPDTIFQVGEIDSLPIDIPDAATRMVIAMKRTLWPEKGAGEIVVEVTSDYFDGKEWRINHGLGGFKTDGGIRRDDCGNIATDSFNETPLPPGRGRKIKVKVISKYDLDSIVSVYFK